jgi:oligopeptide transport system substrate-binding protein
MSRGLLIALVLVAAAIGGYVAFGGKTNSSDVPVLIINNAAEPQTLDPGIEKGVPEARINVCVFEGLTNYDPKDLTPKPGVAETWDLSADGTVYTFHLRPTAKWSNGDPVTATDFEWAWKRVLDPLLASEYVYQIYNYVKNSRAYYDGKSLDGVFSDWGALAADKRGENIDGLEQKAQKRHAAGIQKALEIEKDPALVERLKKGLAAAPGHEDITIDKVGVQAKDDHTLVVTLEAPCAFFLDLTAFHTYYPVHRATVEKHGAAWTRPPNNVSNGPFKMVEWKMKEHILLEKNEHYWDAAKVQPVKIKWLPVENQTTAFNMYEQGQCDWMTDVPREFIEELMKRADYHTDVYLGNYFYGFNTTKGPTKDKRVRRALTLAIDQKAIVKFITRAGEAPATGVVPTGLTGYTSPTMPAYNPEEARKLLAEAGYPDGKGFPKIEILYNTLEAHKKIAAAIQEMWRTQLKIDVELRNVEWKIYLDMQSALQFDVIRRGWIGDYTDPNTFLDMWTSDSGNNNTGWKNPEYDRLIREANRLLDPAKRMKMLAEAEAILIDEMPIAPIYFYVSKNMWRPKVQGVHENVRDFHPLNRARVGGAAP